LTVGRAGRRRLPPGGTNRYGSTIVTSEAAPKLMAPPGTEFAFGSNDAPGSAARAPGVTRTSLPTMTSPAVATVAAWYVVSASRGTVNDVPDSSFTVIESTETADTVPESEIPPDAAPRPGNACPSPGSCPLANRPAVAAAGAVRRPAANAIPPIAIAPARTSRSDVPRPPDDFGFAMTLASGRALAAAGPAARAVSLQEAVDWADVVVLALPWSVMTDVLLSLSGAAGKPVIDASNRLAPASPGSAPSGGEEVARLLPGARVAKAFNTLGAENLAALPARRERAATFVATDDDEVRELVTTLGEELGFEVVDVGPLANSGALEGMTRLWIAASGRLGRGFAFAISHD